MTIADEIKSFEKKNFLPVECSFGYAFLNCTFFTRILRNVYNCCRFLHEFWTEENLLAMKFYNFTASPSSTYHGFSALQSNIIHNHFPYCKIYLYNHFIAFLAKLSKVSVKIRIYYFLLHLQGMVFKNIDTYYK